jgi:hypothetical protein
MTKNDERCHRFYPCGRARVGRPVAVRPPKQPAPCTYAFEWLHSFRFSLQADPRCAYSYVVVPKVRGRGIPVGFLIDAEFPYATLKPGRGLSSIAH